MDEEADLAANSCSVLVKDLSLRPIKEFLSGVFYSSVTINNHNKSIYSKLHHFSIITVCKKHISIRLALFS